METNDVRESDISEVRGYLEREFPNKATRIHNNRLYEQIMGTDVIFDISLSGSSHIYMAFRRAFFYNTNEQSSRLAEAVHKAKLNVGSTRACYIVVDHEKVGDLEPLPNRIKYS